MLLISLTGVALTKTVVRAELTIHYSLLSFLEPKDARVYLLDSGMWAVATGEKICADIRARFRIEIQRMNLLLLSKR